MSYETHLNRIRLIFTGNFIRNGVLECFDHEIHNELSNVDYLHENDFFIDNGIARFFWKMIRYLVRSLK
ncbi:hypothetical protein LO80_02625 [Candidatus Francisella endociliophora]|uniref:Uncharacterized protein n=1 Tax=Candidatus Francisella endociliophora TaxID=653937 RepID=A0A097EN39_9GAMM|nr:hypothetical protein [Francisella sp. FSC1006]AIT08979.1 hypothetical protein LO80_02625 [Francisella sp. FSC1006]